MKRSVWLLAAAVTLLLITVLPACTSNSNTIKAKPGEEFNLKIGQTVSISGEDLKIKILDVINDSRCPQGVVCVWAGEVSCEVEFIYNGHKQTETLTQSGGSDELAEFRLDKYKLFFDVQPYPEEDKIIAESEYYLRARVAVLQE
jgi:hypothetical protein